MPLSFAQPLSVQLISGISVSLTQFAGFGRLADGPD